MHTSKIFSAFALSVLMLLPTVSHSEEYHETSDYQGTEAALLTPWSVFEKSLQSVAGPRKTFEQNIANSVWNLGQFQFHLTNLSWKVISEFQSSSVVDNHFDLNSRNLQIQIKVDRLNIDQYIEEMIDGAIVRTHIVAECAPMTLTQNGAQAQGRVQFQLGGRDVAAQLQQFSLQWAANSWTISTPSCKGPRGFEVTLQSELANRLRSAEEIRPFVQDLLREQLQLLVGNSVERIKAPTVLPLPKEAAPLTVSFLTFESRPEGVITRAKLIWSGKGTRIRPYEVKTWPASISKTQPTLLIPQRGLSDYLKASVAALPKWTYIDMRQFSFFTDLLNNGFIQFFTWPDLLNYPSNAPFKFAIGKPASFDISWNKNGTANVKAFEQGWVQSYRANQWWNYVNITGDAKGVLSPKIQDGRFTLDATLTPSNVKVGFGETYVKTFNPNTYLATGVLNDLITNLGKNFQYNFYLPKLSIGLLGTATAQSWKALEGGSIAVPFSIEAPASAEAESN